MQQVRIALIAGTHTPHYQELLDRLQQADTSFVETDWQQLPEANLVMAWQLPESADLWPKNVPLLLCTHEQTLSAMIAMQPGLFPADVRSRLFGFYPWWQWASRSHWELGALSGTDFTVLEQGLSTIGVGIRALADRPALVTARVTAMIINEGWYALQEQVATISDIDTALKLGVNYPQGPFEWGDKVGLPLVFNTLSHCLAETGDPRYRPAALLQERARLAISA